MKQTRQCLLLEKLQRLIGHHFRRFAVEWKAQPEKKMQAR